MTGALVLVERVHTSFLLWGGGAVKYHDSYWGGGGL